MDRDAVEPGRDLSNFVLHAANTITSSVHIPMAIMTEKRRPAGDVVQVITDGNESFAVKAEAGLADTGSDARRGSNRIKIVSKRDIDDTTLFYNTYKDSVKPIDEEDIKRLNRKNFWFLLCQTWWIAFLIHLDKSTLSQASTMGIFKDVQMSKNEYNDLFVVFYTGYLVALWPGALIAQRIGHKYFITISLLLWALLLGMHPLAKTGKQMIGLRFLLGMLLWWASGSFANVLLTMVAYKLIEDDAHGTLIGGLKSWKWLHIICVILTFIVAAVLIAFLPNSPVDAKWLSTEEKIHTIDLIRETHSGISNSTFKWAQVKECFVDPKSWLFMFWQEKYKPRYVLPWSFMTAFWIISPIMCIIIRFYLKHENRLRAARLEQQGSDNEEDVLDTGDGILRLNDKDLDQTDRENIRFVYPL
ncbi:allantoate permease [Purpureocillium lavendulum]|uniref:Allantoate permease n=1 Tax=Purpureocillium lavendulum TaxID=1247861 RepID=A0AB34G7S1_9HYPO|nr:allantoate permease [Purpureocillium lavendulum]